MQIKTFWLILTYLVGIGELLLAIYFWVTNQRNPIRRAVAFLTTFTGGWVIATAIISYRAAASWDQFGVDLVYAFGVLLCTALVHFMLLFPYQTFKVDRWHLIFLYMPALFIVGSLFLSNSVVRDYVVNAHIPGTVHGGPLLPLYNAYLILLYLLGVGLVLYKIRISDGVARRTSIIVFWSFLIGGISGVIADLIIPFFNGFVVTNALIGVLSSGLWLGMMVYVVVKK